MGLPRSTAQLLAMQTCLGAAKMVSETGEHPAKLRDMVTSPGGTTITGLHKLEAGGLRNTIIDAVEAATKRSKELGQAKKFQKLNHRDHREVQAQNPKAKSQKNFK